MEDIMKALLDVVRAQHSATEGSEEKPFDINDIIDMAMNITGRPERTGRTAGIIRYDSEDGRINGSRYFSSKDI